MAPMDNQAHAPGAGSPGQAGEPLQKADLLAWALPVLLHRLANHTQFLTGFRSVLGMGVPDSFLEQKGPDLQQAGEKLSQVGWLLAVFGSGRGNQLLLSRRERQGLEWMVDLVGEGIRRETGSALLRPSCLPTLAPGALDGWQIPYSLGGLLWQAYGPEASAPGLAGWSLAESPQGNWDLSIPALPRDAGTWALDLMPGAQKQDGPGSGFSLSMPSTWLAAANTA